MFADAQAADRATQYRCPPVVPSSRGISASFATRYREALLALAICSSQGLDVPVLEVLVAELACSQKTELILVTSATLTSTQFCLTNEKRLPESKSDFLMSCGVFAVIRRVHVLDVLLHHRIFSADSAALIVRARVVM